MSLPSLCPAASLSVKYASIVVITHIEEIKIEATEAHAQL